MYFHLPEMTEIIDATGTIQPKIFTVLDCFQEYLEVGIKPSDRDKTSFITYFGQFNYKRMAFGLKNAPFTYQSLMSHVLRGLTYKFCNCFIDDIIVFSKNT